MNQRLITEIGKSQRLRIVNQIKCTQGMTVGQLAEALNMSYMGIKQHCIELEKRGYLDTWRGPRPIGRPEVIYRLTKRAHELYPVESNEMTLELLRSAQDLYGTTAPEKLLFRRFQQKIEQYAPRVKGDSLAERAKWFAEVRNSEGYMAEFKSHEPGSAPEAEQERVPKQERLKIIEHHSPINGLLQAYPTLVGRLEQELFARVLKTDVKREQISASGLYSCTFWLG